MVLEKTENELWDEIFDTPESKAGLITMMEEIDYKNSHP